MDKDIQKRKESVEKGSKKENPGQTFKVSWSEAMKKIVLLIVTALFLSSCSWKITPEDINTSQKACGESGLSYIHLGPFGDKFATCNNGIQAWINNYKGE